MGKIILAMAILVGVLLVIGHVLNGIVAVYN
jgi:hypothetical protein